MGLTKPVVIQGTVGGDSVVTDSNIHIPLNIPTYDDDPNVAHPSVVFVPEGFNGYRYWMAFTPWPNSDRENPSIVASNDGVNWVEPLGIVNPISPMSEAVALGFGYWSDTDMIYNNGELWMYYRGVGGYDEVLVYKHSSDGINWSTQQSLLTVTNTGDSKFLSPTIEKLPDGTFVMFCVDSSFLPKNKIIKRTSADGLTWSAPVECVMPENAQSPWHIDVVYDGTKYHMLFDNNGTWDLCYAYSYDGINWLCDTLRDAIKRTGITDIDGCGFYRSSFVPVPGNPTRFDIWANTINGVNTGYPTVEKGNDKWRMVLYKNVDLFGGETVKLKDTDSIFIPANEFVHAAGTQSLVVQNQILPYRLMTKSALTKIAKSIILPGHFDKVFIQLYWYNLGATTTGNAYFTGGLSKKQVGNNVTTTDSLGFSLAKQAPGQPQYTLVKSDLIDYPRPVTIGRDTLIALNISRDGLNALDTLLEDIAFVGIKISTRKSSV